MIVGVGASRVRDLFVQAKQAAPAIIFIDELDAIGRSRSGGGPNLSGGHDEREQTLNQILTEMDGFAPRESVIVLGATNRPEVLDPALLRPGRFDRRVVVSPPDRAGREAILRVHTRSVPLEPDVDLGSIAASTPGMVGADLANVANEAALLAARRKHARVANEDITDALERIVLGAERKVMISDEDRRRTAYHEAGHAIMGMLTPGADPVRKVSIIPRGMALGVTFSAPDADRFNFDERHLTAQIKVALGGRSAEEVVFGDITTGAESDIQQLTRIARAMVGRWGMSPAIGPIAVLPADGQSPLLPGVSETSQRTQELIDDEVRRIVDTAHRETTETLTTPPRQPRLARRRTAGPRDARPGRRLSGRGTADERRRRARGRDPGAVDAERRPTTRRRAAVARPRRSSAVVRGGGRSGAAVACPLGTSVAEARHPGQRLVALHHAPLDRVVVGPVVHEVPGAVGDLTRVLGRRRLPQPVDERQLELADLVGGLAGSHPRQRFAGRVAPHPGRHQQSIAQLDLVHSRSW